MRRLLNILAVMVGLLSLYITLSSAAGFVLAASTYAHRGAKPPEDLPTLIIIGMCAGLCFLGIVMGSRAVSHLRQPNARSASAVLTIAIYLLVLIGLLPLIKTVPYVVFLLLVSLFFLRRYALKQTVQAFPSEDTPSPA